MSRRVVTYILFCAVAIYGTGLPQFVHYLVDHQGWGTGIAAATHHGCCSHSCPVAPQDDAEHCEEEHDGPCDDTLNCDVCSMLATTHAAVPALVQVMQLHGDSPTITAAVYSGAYLSPRAGPHSPRGPPMHLPA